MKPPTAWAQPRLEIAVKIVLPAALSGIAAAIIVGISRAIGETMIVAIAIGAGPNFTFNPFQGAETMTGHIVRISGGDLSYDSMDYNSLFAIGLDAVLHHPGPEYHQPANCEALPGGVRMNRPPLSEAGSPITQQ